MSHIPSNDASSRPTPADSTKKSSSLYNPVTMSEPAPGLRSHVTLVLCTILHAFTHAYTSLLVPLYILMTADLNLRGVSYASAIMTVYVLVYCIVSDRAGVLADKHNRKVLLGIGLLGNAAAITAMGLTRNYEMMMLFGILAGLFGALFHPAANALIPAHYPKSPGMAIGLLSIGSGIGFYAGPQFAGWRAQTAQWHFGVIGDWQRPLIEAGIAGFIVGIFFLLIAREVHGHGEQKSAQPLPARLRGQIFRIAAVIGCRDFAGLATLSLASIYLQKAHGFDPKHTGFIVGAMMLVSIVVNPLAVYFSPGKRRLPALSAIMVCGGLTIATLPLWPVSDVLVVLSVFMAFQLGSYAVSDAAMLERIPANVRGRAVGIFLMVAGTFSATAPFIMGWWTDHLGASGNQPMAYLPIFITLAAMMFIGACASPLIAHLGPPQGPPIYPLTEISPATAEPAL